MNQALLKSIYEKYESIIEEKRQILLEIISKVSPITAEGLTLTPFYNSTGRVGFLQEISEYTINLSELCFIERNIAENMGYLVYPLDANVRRSTKSFYEKLKKSKGENIIIFYSSKDFKSIRIEFPLSKEDMDPKFVEHNMYLDFYLKYCEIKARGILKYTEKHWKHFLSYDITTISEKEEIDSNKLVIDIDSIPFYPDLQFDISKSHTGKYDMSVYYFYTWITIEETGNGKFTYPNIFKPLQQKENGIYYAIYNITTNQIKELSRPIICVEIRSSSISLLGWNNRIPYQYLSEYHFAYEQIQKALNLSHLELFKYFLGFLKNTKDSTVYGCNIHYLYKGQHTYSSFYINDLLKVFNYTLDEPNKVKEKTFEVGWNSIELLGLHIIPAAISGNCRHCGCHTNYLMSDNTPLGNNIYVCSQECMKKLHETIFEESEDIQEWDI